ncbi:MAG: hypothetical protein IPG56_20250 [Caulobacteraceae bacterium]|nr:hypothetical protein [Caulobacteraceae bacterium]
MLQVINAPDVALQCWLGDSPRSCDLPSASAVSPCRCWQLHRVHHTDLALTSRQVCEFHPVEILLSMLIKIAAVELLSAPCDRCLGV